MDEINDVAVDVSDVTIKIGDTRLLKCVSLRCLRGEWICICGPSGSGKTTLLRTINGLCEPHLGRVVALGSVIPGRRRKEAKSVWRQTGTVLQGESLFETRTARQNVQLAVRSQGVSRQEAREVALHWLQRLGLGDKCDVLPCCLSAGQRQRVAIARALAIEPSLILLDEPTSALDADAAGLVLDAVQQSVQSGAAAVMASHRLSEARERCSKFIELREGRVAV